MPSRPSRHSTLAWRKSKYSNIGADCVEVAAAGPLVLVRDSRSQGAALAFPAAQWSAFTRRIRADDNLSAG